MVATASEIRDKVIAFINKEEKQWNSIKKSVGDNKTDSFKEYYRIEKKSDNELWLHTDGLLYGMLYDTEEGRILVHEAEEELPAGKRSEKEINDNYAEINSKTQLRVMLEKYGWELDNQGSGILTICKIR